MVGRPSSQRQKWILSIIDGTGSQSTLSLASAVEAPPPTRQGPKVRALYDYVGRDASELTVHAGDLITVISYDTGSPDWWEGYFNNRQGLVPRTYVEPLNSITPKKGLSVHLMVLDFVAYFSS